MEKPRVSTDVSRHVENRWLVVRPLTWETRSPSPGDRTESGGILTKKPSLPLSPPSLMVAAKAGEARRTVETPTTAACADG